MSLITLVFFSAAAIARLQATGCQRRTQPHRLVAITTAHAARILTRQVRKPGTKMRTVSQAHAVAWARRHTRGRGKGLANALEIATGGGRGRRGGRATVLVTAPRRCHETTPTTHVDAERSRYAPCKKGRGTFNAPASFSNRVTHESAVLSLVPKFFCTSCRRRAHPRRAHTQRCSGSSASTLPTDSRRSVYAAMDICRSTF
jgi:hypothetical protein